jgi:hypothetical protein
MQFPPFSFEAPFVGVSASSRIWDADETSHRSNKNVDELFQAVSGFGLHIRSHILMTGILVAFKKDARWSRRDAVSTTHQSRRRVLRIRTFVTLIF